MKRQTLLVLHCQTAGMNNILLFHLLFSFILTISVSFSFLAENDFFPDSKKNIYLTKLTSFYARMIEFFLIASSYTKTKWNMIVKVVVRSD